MIAPIPAAIGVNFGRINTKTIHTMAIPKATMKAYMIDFLNPWASFVFMIPVFL